MTFKHDGPDDGGDGTYPGFLGDVGTAMRTIRKIKDFIELIHEDDNNILPYIGRNTG